MVTMSGLDTQPIQSITKAFWNYNFDHTPIDYYAVMPWGDVNDRHILEKGEESETASVSKLLRFFFLIFNSKS